MTHKNEKKAEEELPIVFVVATPIGNLDDLSPRAQRVLAAADIIAAEDTRQTKKLLSHLAITGKRLVSYHEHNEAARAEQLLDNIEAQRCRLALVSDAGTPCISDPGYRLVHAARRRGVRVVPIPGPSALAALASVAGLATDRILFVGFLPTRTAALDTEIRSWVRSRASIVFYESTRRLGKTLAAIARIYPHAQVSIGREMTKLFEETVTLPVDAAIAWLTSHATLKGEASVMVELVEAAGTMISAAAESEDGDGAAIWTEERLLAAAAGEFAKGATLKDLLQKYKNAGLKRPELYRLLLRAKAES